MHIHIHLHDSRNGEVLHYLKKIIMTQAELAAGLNIVTAQVTKIGTETTKTLQKVGELEDVINNLPAGTVTPELQAAFDAVKASVQAVDDLIADAPPVEPPVEG